MMYDTTTSAYDPDRAMRAAEALVRSGRLAEAIRAYWTLGLACPDWSAAGQLE